MHDAETGSAFQILTSTAGKAQLPIAGSLKTIGNTVTVTANRPMHPLDT